MCDCFKKILAKLLGGELNLSAIERDSHLLGEQPDIEEVELDSPYKVRIFKLFIRII
jgi:hypothetical protein